jgi:hypothetical protein
VISHVIDPVIDRACSSACILSPLPHGLASAGMDNIYTPEGYITI